MSPLRVARAALTESLGESLGDASTEQKPDTIFAEFIGQTHLLTFTGDTFTFMRCSDGETGKGALVAAGS